MNPLSLKYNHTTKFILPMAFDEVTKHDDILSNEFIEAYIAIYDDPAYDDQITLVYTDDEEIIESYKIPDKWADDFVKVLAGNYSELSEEYKQHLLDFWDEGSDSPLHRVLFKDKNSVKKDRKLELVEGINFNRLDELWPPPDIKNEIYGFGAL